VISLQINPTDTVQHQWHVSNIWWHLSNHVNTVNCAPILTSKDVHSILFKHALFKHVQMHPHLVQWFIVVLSKKQGGVACSENTAPSYTLLHKSATLCPVSSLATKSWVLMYYILWSMMYWHQCHNIATTPSLTCTKQASQRDDCWHLHWLLHWTIGHISLHFSLLLYQSQSIAVPCLVEHGLRHCVQGGLKKPCLSQHRIPDLSHKESSWNTWNILKRMKCLKNLKGYRTTMICKLN